MTDENHGGQSELARKALAMIQDAHVPAHPRNEDHAHGGVRPIEHADQPPSGNFAAEGQRPVLERSRKVR